MAKGTFATAINCMDGRAQLPVISFITSHYGVDFVNMVTVAGACGVLASGNEENIKDIRRSVSLSVTARGVGLVAVCGHYDCAGNPEGEEIQKKQIRTGMEIVRGWGIPVKVIGLWVGEDWKVEEVGS